MGVELGAQGVKQACNWQEQVAFIGFMPSSAVSSYNDACMSAYTARTHSGRGHTHTIVAHTGCKRAKGPAKKEIHDSFFSRQIISIF